MKKSVSVCNFFPFDDFPCDWAYTIDGGAVGELEYENFNAASAKVTFYGRNIHTGSAKNKMINALALACEFQQSFPQAETPENTEQREGFFHLNHFRERLRKRSYIILFGILMRSNLKNVNNLSAI